jgi:methionine synthase reductase
MHYSTQCYLQLFADQMPKHIAPRTSGVCTLREALTHYVDLTTLPSKRLLILLAQFTSDPAEKAKLTLMATGEGKEDYRVQIELRKASILDILDDFPSCRPPVSYLLDVLPQMQPRYYSLANSLSVFPNEVHFMFVVVDFHTTEPFHKRFRGICTNYLFEKAKNSGLLKREDATGEDFEKKMADMTISEQGGEHPYVAIFPRRSDESFVINADLSRPTIMIGPGTGVAPFIGFLQHRRYRRDHEAIKLGHATLYFGCRHPDKFVFSPVLPS